MRRKPNPIKSKHTQATIASTLGVSQPTVSNWFKLNARPTGLAKAALLKHYPKLHNKIESLWT